ncbi:MAG TPA: hypothetical protein VK152_06550 [Paludibacter sp.]|nr:hypothetical protein [Paludibacter sp.]
MILADNCQQLKQYAQAEQHLELAHGMVPNRFATLPPGAVVPAPGADADAEKLAKQIIDKLGEIKTEMRKLSNRK